MTPPTHTHPDQVDSKIKDMGKSFMVKEKIIKNRVFIKWSDILFHFGHPPTPQDWPIIELYCHSYVM